MDIHKLESLLALSTAANQIEFFILFQDYIYQLRKAPPEFLDNKDTIFINSEDVFFFHKVYVNYCLLIWVKLLFSGLLLE